MLSAKMINKSHKRNYNKKEKWIVRITYVPSRSEKRTTLIRVSQNIKM